MKKLIFIPLLLFSASLFAQIESFETDYIEMIKKDVQAESKMIVKEYLELTEEQAEVFWPLYDEYDAAYDAIVDERVKIIEDYMINYYALDDETVKDLIGRSFDLDQKVFDTRKEYINKMYDVLPASLVAKFYQIDNRIAALVDVVRMSTIPLVRTEEQ
jgi:hypothetical protein